MSDRLRSIIRTVVPGLWATVVLYVVTRFGLPPAAEVWLTSTPVIEGVTNVAALAVVYAVARWVEPHLPDWLTRVLLGSATPPVYAVARRLDRVPGLPSGGGA